jgi:flavin prenyltransferase
MARIVVGVTGASGIVLAHRAVTWLCKEGHQVELVLSKAALYTAVMEMGTEFGTAEGFLRHLTDEARQRVNVYKNHDFGAPIASGSCRTDGMLLIPCSMATLAAVAIGLGDNLIRRAADVTLKERRRLVVVPRETPLHEAHLDNMVRITRMGGVILPPVPAWYNQPQTLEDVENFIVGRALDLLGMDAALYRRWETTSSLI